MRAERIILKNFRNIRALDIELSPGLNVFFGRNGMGKTNVLESIHFASIGRSPRTRKDVEVISFGAESTQIELYFNYKNEHMQVALTLDKNSKKQVKLNNVPTPKLRDMVGFFGSVYFSPDEISIIRGGPAVRRRFLDIVNCQLSSEYLRTLSEYQRCLNQRNQLLFNLKTQRKNLKSQPKINSQPQKLTYPHEISTYPQNSAFSQSAQKLVQSTQTMLDSAVLDVWDEQLSKTAVKIIRARDKFVKQLSVFAKSVQRDLTDNKEDLKLKYVTIVSSPSRYTDEELEQSFLDLSKKYRERDISAGLTNFGVHLDDLKITLIQREKTPGAHLKSSHPICPILKNKIKRLRFCRFENRFLKFVKIHNIKFKLENKNPQSFNLARKNFLAEYECGKIYCALKLLKGLRVNREREVMLDLRKNGSLGQQRTATLSLKIGELKTLEEYYGEPPVLLLDDVLGELDYKRRQKLMQYCKKYQTLVTCTEWEQEEHAKIFEVSYGKVTIREKS